MQLQLNMLIVHPEKRNPMEPARRAKWKGMQKQNKTKMK